MRRRMIEILSDIQKAVEPLGIEVASFKGTENEFSVKFIPKEHLDMLHSAEAQAIRAVGEAVKY